MAQATSRLSAPLGSVEPRDSALSELTFDVAPSTHWLTRLAERPGIHLRLLACRPHGPRGRGLLQLLELSGAREALADARNWLRAHPAPTQVPATARDDRVVFWTVTPTPRVCAWVFENGAVCRSCRFLGDTGHGSPSSRWSVVHPADGTGAEELAGLRSDPEAGIRRVVSVRRWTPDGALTGRQEQALDVAVRFGYFEVPRRASLGKVASELGISRSATAQLLRRGEHRLLSSALSDRRGPG